MISTFVSRQARHFLIPLLLATSLNIASAHANGVNTPITANQPVTGAINGDGVDNYTFNVKGGTSFAVTISAVGTSDVRFVPVIHLLGPGNYDEGEGHALGEIMAEPHPAEGSWTISVSQMVGPGNIGGSYQLTLIQPPFKSGNALTGTPTSGSSTGDPFDLHSFTGQAGHTEVIALGSTAAGFMPEALIFSPSGDMVGTLSCAEGCEGTAKLAAAGTYTVVVAKGVTTGPNASYSISAQEQN